MWLRNSLVFHLTIAKHKGENDIGDVLLSYTRVAASENALRTTAHRAEGKERARV